MDWGGVDLGRLKLATNGTMRVLGTGPYQRAVAHFGKTHWGIFVRFCADLCVGAAWPNNPNCVEVTGLTSAFAYSYIAWSTRNWVRFAACPVMARILCAARRFCAGGIPEKPWGRR